MGCKTLNLFIVELEQYIYIAFRREWISDLPSVFHNSIDSYVYPFISVHTSIDYFHLWIVTSHKRELANIILRKET